jgi:hypothetical protein
MASRINRAIELLRQDQAIYYTGHHTGQVMTSYLYKTPQALSAAQSAFC